MAWEGLVSDTNTASHLSLVFSSGLVSLLRLASSCPSHSLRNSEYLTQQILDGLLVLADHSFPEILGFLFHLIQIETHFVMSFGFEEALDEFYIFTESLAIRGPGNVSLGLSILGFIELFGLGVVEKKERTEWVECLGEALCLHISSEFLLNGLYHL